MRIGVLCHSSIGGSARVAIDLSRGLAQRGHDVHMFSRALPWALEPGADRVTLHSLEAPRRHDPRLRIEWPAADREAFTELIVEVVRRHELELLHFHYAVPFAELAFDAVQRLGDRAPALVGTLHGTDVGAAGAGTAWVLKRLDGLTTVSHSHAELAVREFDLAFTPRVIANTIELRRFSPRIRPRDPVAGGARPRILHVSNFRRVKDPARLARAFVAIRRRCAAELWLVGDGDEMGRVRSILAAGGALGDTRTFGLRTEVESLYPLTDVLVLTSRAESFSLAALEAAASGIPVVAPRVGGLPEVVVDGVTGVLYDLEDHAEPARTLTWLLADAAARARLGAAAARHARAFGHERGVARYEALYHEILRERAAPELVPVGVPAR